MIMKGCIQQEYVTMVNIYSLNRGAPKYTEQISTDGREKLTVNTIIVEVFNPNLHQWIDHPGQKSVRKQWF